MPTIRTFSYFISLLCLIFLISVPDVHASSFPVTRGNPVTINWNVVGAVNCVGSFPGKTYPRNTSETGVPFITSIYDFWINSHAGIGSQTFNNVLAPPDSYDFKCKDAFSGVEDTATLVVADCSGPTPNWNGTACVAAPSSPSIGTFYASPITVPYNTPSALTWGGITNATGGCSIDNGIGAASIPLGSISTPNLIAQTIYTLTCTGTGPDATKTATVSIDSPIIPTGAAPAGANGTAGFYVLPDTVAQGGASKLFWNSSGATSCSMTADSGADPVTGGATSNAVGLTTGPRTINTIFTLTCTNGASTPTTAQATLTVTPAPAPVLGSFTNNGPIASGGSATLSWGAVTGASPSSCTITGTGPAVSVSELGGTLPTGALTLDTIFTLSCDNGFGLTSTKTTTVKIWTALFSSAPTCTILDGSASCSAPISWTSANAPKVSLYDSTLTGYYGTFSSGAHASSVTIPYGGGTYQIREGDHNDTGAVLASTPGTADCNATSAFNAGKCKKQYTITVTQGANGTIAPNTGTYFTGDTPTFTITPDSGYHIVQVIVDGTPKGSIISYTFSALAANHTITATFALGPPPTGTLSANPPSCTIATGSDSCTSDLTWTTINPIGTSQVVADGFTGHDSTPSNADTQTLTVNYGGETYRLYNNSLEIANVSVGATCGVGGYDTVSKTCVDPQPGSINFIGGNYFGPGTVTVTCSGADKYAVYKSGAPTVVRATTTYLGVPVVVPITTSDTYWYVCIKGSFAVPSTLKDFFAPPPPSAKVSLEVSPRTISKDGVSTLSWNILYPVAACRFTAKSVCTNNVCSPSQLLSEAALTNKIVSPTEYTDADDKYSIAGPRSILTTIQNVAPGHGSTDQRGFGKKTFKITHTTDFTIDCGGAGHMETKRVQVTKSDEQ